MGFLADPGSQSACQDDCFHIICAYYFEESDAVKKTAQHLFET
jgi:hypothetical protein